MKVMYPSNNHQIAHGDILIMILFTLLFKRKHMNKIEENIQHDNELTIDLLNAVDYIHQGYTGEKTDQQIKVLQ